MNTELRKKAKIGVEKSNWINDRWIRFKNHGRVCWIKGKNL